MALCHGTALMIFISNAAVLALGRELCAAATFITGYDVNILRVDCALGSCEGCTVKLDLTSPGVPCTAGNLGAAPAPVPANPVNPVSEILNVLGLRQKNLQISNPDPRPHMKTTEAADPVLWRWLDLHTIAYVTVKVVCHWSKEGEVEPAKKFDIGYSMKKRPMTFCATIGTHKHIQGTSKFTNQQSLRHCLPQTPTLRTTTSTSHTWTPPALRWMSPSKWRI